MRTIVSHLALLLEDEEQKIIDIWKNGSLSHFLSYFSVMELSSPFLKIYPSLSQSLMVVSPSWMIPLVLIRKFLQSMQSSRRKIQSMRC